MNRSELQQRISSVKEELEKLENELKDYTVSIEEAQPGDTLNDGCIVIERYSDHLLIAAPIKTEVQCKWTPEFSEVFDSLKNHGLIPAQWYVPSLKELRLAYKNCRNHFSSTFHWSSTESSFAYACDVNFIGGSWGSNNKTSTLCVRAFRRVHL